MGSDNEMTAEEFLKQHGEESYSIKSLFESSIIVSLDAMKDIEEKNAEKEFDY